MTAPGTRLNRSLQRIARVCAFVAAAFGLLALAGWSFDVEPLRGIFPGLIPMNPMTALALLVAGTVLWVVEDSRTAGARLRVARRGAGRGPGRAGENRVVHVRLAAVYSINCCLPTASNPRRVRGSIGCPTRTRRKRRRQPRRKLRNPRDRNSACRSRQYGVVPGFDRRCFDPVQRESPRPALAERMAGAGGRVDCPFGAGGLCLRSRFADRVSLVQSDGGQHGRRLRGAGRRNPLRSPSAG